MRTYLELFEILQPESAEEPDFIRIDVTDWSQRDINSAIELLREHAQVYEHYTLQIHYCAHEEGGSCSAVLIESG
jgi:hypothetical protein